MVCMHVCRTSLSWKLHTIHMLPTHLSILPTHVSILHTHLSILPDHLSILPSHLSILCTHLSILPHYLSILPSHLSILCTHLSILPRYLSISILLSLAVRTYLLLLQGPMWRQIRGMGLSYHYSMRCKIEEGLLYFILFRSAQVAQAFEVAKKILVSYHGGQEKGTRYNAD